MNKITIELGGKEYSLVFGGLAMYSIENELGIPHEEWLNKISFNRILTMFWGSLLHSNPNLQLKSVIPLMPVNQNSEEYLDLVKAVLKAYIVSQGQDASVIDDLLSKEEKQEKKAKESTKGKKNS